MVYRLSSKHRTAISRAMKQYHRTRRKKGSRAKLSSKAARMLMFPEVHLHRLRSGRKGRRSVIR